ncbi:hypothetical protein ABZZ17_38595 [Streptomyces sp. NPDC006512]|uniref:hypothetical protein n=1 Tax=Streptomyces sp. NPDC006512 TaxID=3154307 RepID=UPI0033A644EA
MRITRALAVLIATAALATACTQDGGSRTREWEPDDALQRVQRAFDADDADTTLIAEASKFVVSGIDQTLDTPGDKPYRFDMACDTQGVPSITLTLIRGETTRTFEVRCGNRQVVRVNVPAGSPVTAKVPSIETEPPPSGVIVWNLSTIEPTDVQGCRDDIQGCEA